MRSMTGFGEAQIALGESRLLVETRAVNHRYLEVRVRMPRELADQATFVEQLARKSAGRGRAVIGKPRAWRGDGCQNFRHSRNSRNADERHGR